MRIINIEPTPSPNSMKVNLDEHLPEGMRYTYSIDNLASAPEWVRRLLAIPGVKEIFHTADFIAVERAPKADWQAILQAVRAVFGEQLSDQADSAVQDDHFGEANVLVQKFRGIPLQIRVKSEEQEERIAMPERFIQAAMQAQYGSPNLIKERVLVDYGVRYGERKEIAEQILQELEAAYDDNRLKQLVTAALDQETAAPVMVLTREEIAARLDDPSWKIRYAALEKLKPEKENLPLIEKALADEHYSIRRLAVVYLGDIGQPEVFPLLYRMLKDASASVRRTAGDCLSDIGNPDAIGPMCEALEDPAKIVRWRAARYLFEVGDESALPALRKAADDSEFEIRMQIQYAIARIEGGEAAAGSVWQQMTRRER